jgi:hypothetical protein
LLKGNFRGKANRKPKTAHLVSYEEEPIHQVSPLARYKTWAAGDYGWRIASPKTNTVKIREARLSTCGLLRFLGGQISHTGKNDFRVFRLSAGAFLFGF